MTIEHAHNLQSPAVPNQAIRYSDGPVTPASSSQTNGRLANYDMGAVVKGSMRRLLVLMEEMKQAIGIESVRLFNDSGEFDFQIMRSFRPAVPLEELLALTPELPPATAVLGLTEDGRPLTHSFSVIAKPNILISGHESAGKTILLQTIAASLALTSKQAQVQLLAINPVTSDRERHEAHDFTFRQLSYLPHMLTDVAVRQTEITDLLQFLVREINYRQEHGFTLPRIIILIDQAATVLEHGGRPVKQAVQTIAERGSQTGIYLVLSTRHPECLDPQLTAHIPTHFMGRLDLNKATDSHARPSEVEATTLLGEGDFQIVGSKRGLRFQAAYIDSSQIYRRLSQIYRQQPILLAQAIDSQVKLMPKNEQPSSKKEQLSFLDDLASTT